MTMIDLHDHFTYFLSEIKCSVIYPFSDIPFHLTKKGVADDVEQ